MIWLSQIVDEVIARHPEGEILISSGGSPSGTYHLGHMRELVTCDAILLELRRRGRQAKHIYFVDDLDIFRKVPVNVPAEWEQYLGMPICDVPSPDGAEGKSYADYFLQGLIDSCKVLNVEVEFVRSHPKYRSGWFVPAIELCLQHIPQIKQALETVSNRKLEDNWTPIQVLEKGRLKKRAFVSIDTATKTIRYIDADNTEQTAHYATGEVKLDWRLDWPARWWQLKVHVEPFGREHASGGSSYETGVQLMETVYKAEPPVPVPYGDINMVGDTKKMSASKGTSISAMESTQIMPAEVIRYFILRAPITTILFFDPVDGVVKLMDEFAALTAKTDRNAIEESLLYVSTRGKKAVVSRVPFSHLVASYQASLKDADKTLDVIKRTEHSKAAEEDASVIREELKFIDEWLRLRAPEEVKFALADRVKVSDFSPQEQTFLKTLGQNLEAAPANADGTYFHERIYELKDRLGLQPKEMFAALYRALIGKTSGPRAGWFLSILPRKWLLERLSLDDAQDSGEGMAPTAQSFVSEASVTGTIRLRINPQVQANFPEATIGYVVATAAVGLKSEKADCIQEALKSLQGRGVTAENLTQQPEIAVWRTAFKTFGVKPSDYLSSAEALAKRALKGNPPHVSPLVDAYNAVSIKHLVPMGAVDLQKITGDITVRYGREGERAELLGMVSPITVTANQVVYADDRRVITWLWNHRDAAATAVTADSRQIIFFADSLLGPDLAKSAISELIVLLEQMGVEIAAHGIVGKSGA